MALTRDEAMDPAEAMDRLLTIAMCVDSLARMHAEGWVLTWEERDQARIATTNLQALIAKAPGPRLAEFCSELLAKLEPLTRPKED